MELIETIRQTQQIPHWILWALLFALMDVFIFLRLCAIEKATVQQGVSNKRPLQDRFKGRSL